MLKRRELALAAIVSIASIASIASAGCENKKRPPSPLEVAADSGIRVATHATPDAAFVESGALDGSSSSSSSAARGFDCTEAAEGDPKSAKSIGHTSLVFKMELSNGKKYAFKPNAKKVKDRYRGEIAAYRFAEALGVHNVPPACFRVFDASPALFTEEALSEDGKTKGVLIPWIDGLGFWAIEKEPLKTETHEWLLNGKTVPEDKVDLARQLSTMIVFDSITGNWDRLSGGNVGLDKAGTTVLYIDNDAAFMETPPTAALAKNKRLVESTDRFSKNFITQLRRLDEEKITTMIGDESPGQPLVSKSVITAMAKRAKEALAVIDAKITKNGLKETLFFK